MSVTLTKKQLQIYFCLEGHNSEEDFGSFQNLVDEGIAEQIVSRVWQRSSFNENKSSVESIIMYGMATDWLVHAGNEEKILLLNSFQEEDFTL